MNADSEMILKKDAPLYIDVYCYSCKKLIALSNAIKIDGRRFCQRCAYGEYK